MKLYKSQSGIAHVLLVVLAVLVIGAVGFTGWKVYKSKNKPAANTQTNQTAQKKDEIPEGLVEYKNEELGIAFSYPARWDMSEKAVSVVSITDFVTNWGISGIEIIYDAKTQTWIDKETKEPIDKQPTKVVDGISIYNFGGGDGDPPCAFGIYVFTLKSSVVKVQVPTACEVPTEGTSYLFSQQEKDIEEFINSLAINKE